MLRKIGAVLVLILAGLGLLLCLAGLIGTWVVKAPITDALTSTLTAAGSYVTLAGNTAATAGSQAQAAQQRVTALQSRAADAQIGQTLRNEVVPAVKGVRATVGVANAAAAGLNSSLVAANRIPGVNVPTFTEELEKADQVLAKADDTLTALGAKAANAQLDGSEVGAALTAASDSLGTVQALLNGWSQQAAGVNNALAAATAATPRWINWTTVLLSLLFLLFGAGQVSLLLHAWQWLRA